MIRKILLSILYSVLLGAAGVAQAAIQGEQVRVTGKSRDDLQAVMALLRKQKLNQALQYTNFRD